MTEEEGFMNSGIYILYTYIAHKSTLLERTSVAMNLNQRVKGIVHLNTTIRPFLQSVHFNYRNLVDKYLIDS